MGLGNPGAQHQQNRHNFGFMAVDHYAISKGLRFRSGGKPYLWTEDPVQTPQGWIAICLCKPITFMNNSGAAARQILRQYDLKTDQLLVIYDDIDLSLGRIRLRKKGSAGGHRGIQSISEHLYSQDFPRLRLGIGPQEQETAAEDFVLANFRDAELPTVQQVLNLILNVIHDYLSLEFDSVMNIYNSTDLRKSIKGEA
jgi:PTH1 family peptidyl-tRNA hydrolase